MNPTILESLKAARKAGLAQPLPVDHTRPTIHAGRRHRLPPVLLGLGLGVLSLTVAGWSAVSNPALVAVLSGAAPTAMPVKHAQSWAPAEIAKPAYTPTATQTATPIPTSTSEPTATLEPANPPGLLMAEIVVDTPTLEYVPAEMEAAAPVIADGSYTGSGKSILVDLSEQYLYAYEVDVLVYSFIASTGLNNATATGHFAVQSKIPNAYGSTWDIWMPNWLGIYWSGGLENGIHALPILPNGAQLWAGYLGRPVSYGCVVLGAYEAKLLYDWADYGTPVNIQW